MRFPSGTVDQYLPFSAFDEVGSEPLSGLTAFTVYRSRNGAAAVAYTSPTIVERRPGLYWLLLDEDMTIDAGDDEQAVALTVEHEGMQTWIGGFELFRPKITLGETSSTQTGDSFSRLGAPAGASVSADVAALPQVADLATKAQVAAETLGALDTTSVPASPTSGTYAERLSKIQTGSNVAAVGDLTGLALTNTVTADRVPRELTYSVGSEGNAARNIVTLNAWSSGTRTLAFDLSELLDQSDTTIGTVSTVTVVKGVTSITTSNLRKHQNQKVAMWDTAVISSANVGDYTVTVTVTTADSNTIVVTGTLRVE